MKCPYCNKEMSSVSGFCPECGQSIVSSVQTKKTNSYWNDINTIYLQKERLRVSKVSEENRLQTRKTILTAIILCMIVTLSAFGVKKYLSYSSEIPDEILEVGEGYDSGFKQIKEAYEDDKIDYAEAKNALEGLDVNEFEEEEANEVLVFREILEEDLEKNFSNLASDSDYESLMEILAEMEGKIESKDVFLVDMRKKYETDYIQNLNTKSRELLMKGEKEEALQILKTGESLVEDKDTVHALFLEVQNSVNLGVDAYIIPESNIRYLTDEDINGLNIQQINYAKNEIYARHGRKFQSNELQTYFNSKSWYNGTIEATAFNEGVLNDYERKNAEKLSNREFSMESGGYKLDQ